jgi:hypothetical protein
MSWLRCIIERNSNWEWLWLIKCKDEALDCLLATLKQLASRLLVFLASTDVVKSIKIVLSHIYLSFEFYSISRRQRERKKTAERVKENFDVVKNFTLMHSPHVRFFTCRMAGAKTRWALRLVKKIFCNITRVTSSLLSFLHRIAYAKVAVEWKKG